ncbi:MBL fold metallo-hydrolase [Dysgonomonas sp. Marseille-P4677]|uniref:MBL fold metallo-hydrolase n=1 Tax=Dysgonomonas sp. Marseille-P4677 TaxID=2364790 RepID=UPI001914B17A|nr:MBL fold metallo-hydrolase [Dysgonomonas sp. Marseille-P4677]MBK5720262.1 MBL fold metallo-hydrolase [Dysgonomonas sp. Marseille-P4677]
MFKINIIESGYIMADGGAMFGAIPKRVWQRKYPANEENLCPLAMRCILAISENHKILIDTGIGDQHTKQISYYQPKELKNIAREIENMGYSINDITDIVLTHLHFDHCGYATYRNENENIVPSFPNAKYWISKKQWENAQNPNRLESDSIFIENILAIKESGLLSLIDKDISLYDGFSVQLFDGHTSGQLVVYINTKEGIHVLPGDLIPTSSHVSLNWISAYDICALTSVIEKERFLAEAERDGYTLIYYHDAFIKSSKVKKVNDNYKALITKL